MRWLRIAVAVAVALAGLNGVAGAAELRYLAIGDSITVWRPDRTVINYVGQLKSEARDLPFTTIGVAAVSGATTRTILDRWDTLVAPHLPAHVISVMLGTNDHIRPTRTHVPGPGEWKIGPRISVDQYAANMAEIVRRLRAVPHGDAFNGGLPDIVLVAPPFVATRGAWGEPTSQARLSLYVDTLSRMAGRGVRFLNLNEITGRMVNWDSAVWETREWTTDGGTHPTSETHTRILPYIREAIVLRVR